MGAPTIVEPEPRITTDIPGWSNVARSATRPLFVRPGANRQGRWLGGLVGAVAALAFIAFMGLIVPIRISPSELIGPPLAAISFVAATWITPGWVAVPWVCAGDRFQAVAIGVLIGLVPASLGGIALIIAAYLFTAQRTTTGGALTIAGVVGLVVVGTVVSVGSIGVLGGLYVITVPIGVVMVLGMRGLQRAIYPDVAQ